MKNIRSFLLFTFILLISFCADAQNGARFKMIHERIVQARMQEIKVNLKLDQKKFEQFRPIYLKYNSEMSEINFLKVARLTRTDPDSLSATEADQLIANQLENAKKIISIREKYYKEFRAVLTPQQIVKLHQTEAELRKKVTEEVKRRRMNRQ